MEEIVYKASVGKRRDIILTLYREGPLTFVKLRNKLGLSASALLYELAALESLELVKREDTVIYLTKLGEKVASIISTMEPLETLSFLTVIGLRSFVVWLLLSPVLHITALILLTTWTLALVMGAMHNPPLVYLGVTYVGYNLPRTVTLSTAVALAVSMVSIALVLGIAYKTAKITPYKTVIGMTPLAIYPALHMTLVEIARQMQITQIFLSLEILLFISQLLTATVFATVYSIETGHSYEKSLLRTLVVFFIIPAMLYISPIVHAISPL